VVWIDSAGVAVAESRFPISLDNSQTTLNELSKFRVKLLGFSQVARVLKPWSPVELQQELQKLLFSVSLFSSHQRVEKPAKIFDLQLMKSFL
jgi:hypothetical protein